LEITFARFFKNCDEVILHEHFPKSLKNQAKTFQKIPKARRRANSMNGGEENKIHFGEFEFDAARRRLSRRGEPLPLYAKTFDLLAFLIEQNGRIVSKDEILERVWAGQFVEEANLSVQISALRKALGEKKNEPRYIFTIPGKGYRFVADLDADAERLVIERHGYSRLVIEESEAADEPSAARRARAAFPRNGRVGPVRLALFGAAAAVLLIGLGFGLARFFGFGTAGRPFQKVVLTRLTNQGTIAGAAVSPDGKYIVSVQREADGNSLWIQQIGTASRVSLLPPAAGDFWGLTFSPDGAFIYYNFFSGEKTDVELFRVSSLGGVTEKIAGVVASSIAFAPDGKHFAFVRSDSAAGSNYLIIAEPDGAGQRVLAAKKYPDTFLTPGAAPAWSPDGRTLACPVARYEPDGTHTSIVGVRLDGGEASLSDRRWHNVNGLGWIDGGLVLAAADRPDAPSQIWLVPPGTGEPRRITNDLSNYGWLTATSDGKSLAAVQTNEIHEISAGSLAEGTASFRSLVTEAGALHPLVWTPDGKIVFRSHRDGGANLWIMDADGANRRQLTTGAQVDARGLCRSPDGRYLVFTSLRSGKSNLWRVAAAGGDLVQLTDGEADAYPRCLADNQTVVFQRGIYNRPVLWKVALAGGEPVQLTDFRAKWAAPNRAGEEIAFLQMVDDRWRFGFISAAGRLSREPVGVPANLTESALDWSRDDLNLFYIGTTGSVGNVWSLPAAGGEARPVTDFASGELTDFAFAPDGTRLAVARNSSFRDVVLISGENER
jgi:DNA-binding winged helix-turn-helix (wHTH) protein/Tol biopolymer transport system component